MSQSMVDLYNNVSKLAANSQENRQKLQHYLQQLYDQCQSIMRGLQTLQEDQLTLQNTLTGSLSQFEEQAGTGQGIQGLFNGNTKLKNEIMQKRVAMEQAAFKLRESANWLSQSMKQMEEAIQQTDKTICNQMEQDEKQLLNMEQQLLAQVQPQSPFPSAAQLQAPGISSGTFPQNLQDVHLELIVASTATQLKQLQHLITENRLCNQLIRQLDKDINLYNINDKGNI